MAINVTYGTETASIANGSTLTTAGKVMAKDLTITVPTVNPAFDGGGVTIEDTDMAIVAANASVTTTNTSGVAVTSDVDAYIVTSPVLYNGAVDGYVSKPDNATALPGWDIGDYTPIGTMTRYVDNITVPTEKTLTVTTLTGRLNVSAGAGSLYRTGKIGTTYINGTAAGDKVVVAGDKVSVDGTIVTDSDWNLKTANPAFTGGDASATADFSHTETNVTISDIDTGISIQPNISVDYSRASVLYNGAVNGWVNKANNDVAMEAETYMPEMGFYDPIYISGVTVPSGKTFTVNSLAGRLNVNAGSGSLYRLNTSGYNYINGTSAGNRTVYTDTKGVTVDGVKVTDTNWDLLTANPAFDGGAISLSGSATYTSTNVTASSSNTSGISIVPSANIIPTRASVLYNGAVAGWVSKADNTVALSADTGTSIPYTGSTVYITGVSVPSGKTFTVNGGGDKGVKVEYKKVTVDTFPVTNSNGDLLLPSYNSTTKVLTYPMVEVFTSPTTTYTATVTGNVTSINGMTIKDNTGAVTGSGTAPSNATYGYYLAKWTSASALGTGSKVTMSTSAPSGGSNGDIWYQIL